ncbi:uncharacterized protein [Onthophagus taurus]|uniref:uncharacterized protein n=1 Tax=Onthophagus taurus TaxID=166361 RepID=UPI000C20EF41|nr:uncharacterized protein LOC111414611 [Onthophagus taurus]
MFMAKTLATGAMIMVILTITQYAFGDVPIRPPRPNKFTDDAQVREYMKNLRTFLDKGAIRYGKRNTYSSIDSQNVEEPSEDFALIKEYPDPSVQHLDEHRSYPEWFKQASSRLNKANKAMWY